MTRQIPESRIALTPIVIDDSKRGGIISRKTYKFLCKNFDCMSEVSLTLTEESYNRRFYFSDKMPCPICARDMYQVE